MFMPGSVFCGLDMSPFPLEKENTWVFFYILRKTFRKLCDLPTPLVATGRRNLP